MPVYLKKQTPNTPREFLKDEAGAAAIVMALLTPILIGGLAFGAEIGFWELQKRKMQNAADTAAHAAATQLRSGETDDATLKNTAYAIAGQGGYKGALSGITLQQPPTAGAYAGNNMAVHVEIASSIPRRFSGIFDSSPVEFAVGATALVNNGRPACVLALHPSASGAISTGGSTTVTLTGCDIAANSISSSAITATGNGSSVTAECISAVGDVAVNSTYTLTCPAPIANGPKTADPYASVAMPDTSTCPLNPNNFTQNGNPSTPGSTAGQSTFCYAGSAWNFNRSINLTANKTYVLKNTHATNTANLHLSGGRSITGTNVTIILVGRWDVRLNGNSTINISAPTSGTYKGIALFGDRDNAVSMDLTGNNGAKIVGAVYSPNAGSTITYTGSNLAYSAGQCTQVIAGKVSFWGNSNFSTDCSNSGTTEIRSARSIRIVE